MKNLTQQEVNKIIAKHQKWLRGEEGGEKADFSKTNLINIYFDKVDLTLADFSNSYISNVKFSNSNFFYSNFSFTHIKKIVIEKCNFSYSTFMNSEFQNSNIIDTIFSSCNFNQLIFYMSCFKNSTLSKTDMTDSRLTESVFYKTSIYHTNFSGSKINNTKFSRINYNENTAFFAQSCPEKGSFIGFKKCGKYIVELQITEDAKRSSATSRKCRCSKAKVLSITNLNGSNSELSKISSNRDSKFIYKIGETVEVKDFDENRWNECSTGIHFFITRDEAVRYQG